MTLHTPTSLILEEVESIWHVFRYRELYGWMDVLNLDRHLEAVDVKLLANNQYYSGKLDCYKLNV